MLKRFCRKTGVIFYFLCVVMFVQAQYVVTGGTGTPYLEDDSNNRVHVYLVNGMENLTISYTSASSTTHQWYKFKTKALEREPVACEQNGTTSVIRNIEEGSGYYVDDPASGLNGWFVWIIDYSKYAFNPQTLTVKYGDCSNVRLALSPLPTEMTYRLPATGASKSLKRQYEVAYQTLNWSDTDKQFSQIAKTVTLSSANSDNLDFVPAPLCDTEFTLSGDQYAKYFNENKSLTTETYQAVAVEAHADTTLTVDNAPNLISGEEGLSAPVSVHFKAYVNDPVASLLVWKIYKDTEEDNPLIRYTGNELDYTFREAGTFTASLEVSDRSGTCTDNSNTYSFKIVESFLDVPNAFSPGTTPGVNDEFRVAYKSIVDYKIWIFNRWGVEMYHSTNPGAGWDGKKSGKYVAPGVYFYVIEAKGSDGVKHNRRGSINILRPKTIDDTISNE